MRTRKLEPDELAGQMMHEVVQSRLSKELKELRAKLEAVLMPIPLGILVSNHITQIDVSDNGDCKLPRDKFKTAIASSDMIRYAEYCYAHHRIPEIERDVKNEIIRRLELIPME